jgi:hypothetical protein
MHPFIVNHAVFEIRHSNLLARKLQNYNIYIDSIEKIWQMQSGPNQFSLTVGHPYPLSLSSSTTSLLSAPPTAKIHAYKIRE